MKLPFTRATVRSLIVVTTVGLVAFWVGRHTQYTQDLASFNAIHPVREKETSYTFISPLLGYSIPSDIGIGEYQPLLNVVQSIIKKAKRSKDIEDVSVYFRNLKDNHWFGIDPTQQYYPASLLKVPIMIAYLQKAEKNPAILQRVLVEKSLPAGQATEFDSPSTLTPGRAYSIFQLIEAMIIKSDNGAMLTLFTYLDALDPKALDTLYGNLGEQKPGDNSSHYQISPRAYGWFFRILYNASYLSADQSEEALKFLSQVTFKDGLVAGVPVDITVAHKFGEHLITDGAVISAVQMHDCGIIYAPQNPYFLCVMTQTKSEAASKKVIQDISRAIYQGVNK